MDEAFDGKVAFVTGAAHGQGRSHAVNLARRGVDLILLDICDQIACVPYELSSPEDLATTVRLVEECGRAALPVQADVRSSAAVDEAVARGLERFGRLDFVVANAGLLAATGRAAREMDAWDASIATMLSGVYYTLRAAATPMIEGDRGGSIVITSSTAGFRGSSYKPELLTPGQVGYTAAKHGVLGIMRSFALALGPHGIRVNTVHPTGVRTAMVVNESFASAISNMPAGFMANPMGIDLIEPQDVSDAVLWLLSDASRYVTGSTIAVDAGLLLL